MQGAANQGIQRVVRGDGKGDDRVDLEKAELVKFLEANIDVFAWNAYDVPGIDLKFIFHQLNVNPEAVPRRQLLGDHLKIMPRQSRQR